MRVVLDASAIIYLNDFSRFDEMYTVYEVLEEIKDKISSLKLSSIKIKIREPNFNSIMDVTKIAKETGDLDKLSTTDIKVLALAKTTDSIIISDDRNIQNVAEKMGIKYFSIFNEKIRKFIKWIKVCKSCGKKYKRGNICKVCGSKLYRVPEKTKYLGKTKA
jgi:UPF0271 protein